MEVIWIKNGRRVREFRGAFSVARTSDSIIKSVIVTCKCGHTFVQRMQFRKHDRFFAGREPGKHGLVLRRIECPSS